MQDVHVKPRMSGVDKTKQAVGLNDAFRSKSNTQIKIIFVALVCRFLSLFQGEFGSFIKNYGGPETSTLCRFHMEEDKRLNSIQKHDASDRHDNRRVSRRNKLTRRV